MERSRVNWVCGWLMALGLPLVVVWLDPLELFPPDRDLEWAIPLTVQMAALSVGSYACLARPRVEIWADRLVIRNIVRDIAVPTSSIDEIDDTSGTHLRLRVGRRWYTASATQSSVLDGVLGRTTTANAIALAARELNAEGSQRPPVAVTVRRPEWVELALLLFWTIYIAVGLVS